MNTKKCSICKTTKPIDSFYKVSKAKAGRQPYCILCNKSLMKQYYTTKKGLLTSLYLNQKVNSKTRKHAPPSYTKEALGLWMFSQPNFEKLYSSWVKSGYSRYSKPSIDRLDDYKGYSLENIQLMTWKENQDKFYEDVMIGKNTKKTRPVMSTSLITGETRKYASSCIAQRKTGAHASLIRRCCKGQGKTAGGMKWTYISECDL